MRIDEITNSLTPDKFTPGRAASAKDAGFGLGDNQEELGAGIFGAAFSTKEEPGTVRKIVGPIDEHAFKQDAYFKYLQLLAKNDRFTSNPYFPKIFDLKVKKIPLDPNEPTTFYDYAYAVDMERLHSLEDYDNLSQEEALMLGKRMFHNYEQIAARQIEASTAEYGRGENVVKHVSYIDALIKFLSALLDDFYPIKKATIYKDPKLKQAIMLLRKLHSDVRIKGQPMFFDIHMGNVMVRRGPGGPQLVFTDPVAN